MLTVVHEKHANHVIWQQPVPKLCQSRTGGRVFGKTSRRQVRAEPPTVSTGPESVRFTRRAKPDIPALLWERHPRCMHE